MGDIKISVQEANKAFDWYFINDTMQYKIIMSEKKKRYNLADEHEFDWKNGRGEKCSKI